MSRWGGRKVARLKWQVAAVHGTACYVCGCAIDMGLAYPDPHSASVEHVVPRSKGGSDDLAGLRLSHLRCNVSRGNRPRKTRTRRAVVRSPIIDGVF